MILHFPTQPIIRSHKVLGTKIGSRLKVTALLNLNAAEYALKVQQYLTKQKQLLKDQ